MQSLNEIKWIRLKKEEYKTLFKKELIINVKGNFNKDITEKDVKNKIEQLCNEYSINFDEFCNRRIKKNNKNEYCFIKDYGNYLLENGLSFEKYASYINKDRTTIKHHLK